MKLLFSRWLKKQQGFTLIEILIALAIAGVLFSGVTMATFQIFSNNTRNNARMTAVQQVQSGVYWVSHDVQMAQNIEPSGVTGFPLQLSWVEWETNDVYSVLYSLDQGDLVRTYSVNGGPEEELKIAHYINTDSDKTFCSNSGRVLTLSLTASVPAGATMMNETRKVEVLARPGS